MQEIDTADPDRVRGFYRHFAEVEAAPVSPLYADWAGAIADDEQVIAALMQLPAAKRQPNLVFAAARVHGMPLVTWQEARQHLLQHWETITQTVLRRRTQTNEAGRTAVLNLAFARIAEETGQPLALIEVGVSGGLCLYPDAWPLRYHASSGETILSPAGVLRSGVDLRCQLQGLEAPTHLPEVAWRAGIDLNPLDLTLEADLEWLRALVWPGMDYRLERITAGAQLVQADPPNLFSGDLNELLPTVLRQVPQGAVPVVFHSAVLVYLTPEDRTRFLQQVRQPGVRWVSNEGLAIFPEIAAKLPGEDAERSGFILALDGEPLARSGPHGQYLHGLT